jgi:hypothetical protein
MKFFSDCSGSCNDCALGYTGCLAGHGDDDFVQLTESDIPHILRFADDSQVNRLMENHPEYERSIKLHKIKNS